MPKNQGKSFLEVQTKSSTNSSETDWKAVGELQNNNSADTATRCNTPSSTNNESHLAAASQQYPYRKNLPLRIKNLLSPNATIKAHRKANYLYRHSSDKIDSNLLIFLHGAGDNHLPYYNLAKKMNIPQCATLSLSATCMGGRFVTLPLNLGHSWFVEMDYSTGAPLHKHNFKLVSSLNRAVETLDNLLEELIGGTNVNDVATGTEAEYASTEECETSWIPERIFLFGFSAGACLAMQTCLDRFEKGKLPLGGAICIAGGSNKNCSSKKISGGDIDESKAVEKTPVLIIGGSKDEKFTPDALNESIDFYNSYGWKSMKGGGKKPSLPAKAFIMKGKGHGMINSEEETKAVMEFCGEKMVRRMLAMEGFCEISPDQFQT